ncbi:MAG: hypothetical protein MZU97_24955 [Bacillus subtilis]|nr:hypothetical protein [Bacillus subtilis]
METEFIVKTEISAIFEASRNSSIFRTSARSMAAIDLSLFYSNDNQNTLLNSASMHATISDQILALGDDALIVPNKDINEATIILTVLTTTFIVKDEIKAIFESLEILNISDIGAFDGAIDLSLFYSNDNQNTLLSSASMHATISDQISALSDDALLVPTKDITEVTIITTVLTTTNSSSKPKSKPSSKLSKSSTSPILERSTAPSICRCSTMKPIKTPCLIPLPCMRRFRVKSSI